MNTRAFVLVSVLAAVTTSAGMAQRQAPEQAAVDAYRTAITSAASGRAPRAIETAFRAL